MNKLINKVLKAWCKVNFKPFIEDEESYSQIIWASSHIKINGTPLLWPVAMRAGLKRIEDLHTENGLPMSYIQFQAKFGNCITWLEFYTLCFAIPENWLISPAQDTQIATLHDQLESKNSISSFVYKFITKDCCMQEYCNRWNKLFVEIEPERMRTTLVNIYTYTMSTKLRDFQYRLLLNAIVTSKDLYRWRIKDNNQCYFCEVQTETITHLLFNCERVRALWVMIQDWIENNVTLSDTLDVNLFNIIINEIHPTPSHLVNMFCLITKQYIYRMPCNRGNLSTRQLIREIYAIHSYEWYFAKSKGKLKKHCHKSSVLFPELVETYNIDSGTNNNYIANYINTI